MLGNYCVLFKGCSNGSISSGKREGVSWLGESVVVVFEGITIGNNVLIAVDSFVDFDVPSNSIVFAKPAEIYHKLNSYIYYVKGEAV